jgi:hypothetical protein
MSSKIVHPPGGLPHVAPTGKQEAGPKKAQSPRGSGRAGPKASVGRRALAQNHAEDDVLVQADVKDEGQPHPDGHRGAQADSQSARPAEGLALPKGGRGLTSMRPTGAGGATGAHEVRRPEHQVWARLIAQASPERLAQGQAVLGEHKAALVAFAKLVPGIIKPR